MFSKNNAYYYQQVEQDLFERELPFKSLKLPYNKQKSKILKFAQKKHEIEQLRQQIKNRCKVQELEYLEILKRQREVMQQDIKKRKMMIQYQQLEQKIAQNKGNHHKNNRIVQDSLQQLQKEQQKRRNARRADSAIENQVITNRDRRSKTARLELSQQEMGLMLKMKRQSALKNYGMWKQEQIKKIKENIVNRYKFGSESAQKPVNEEQMEIKPQQQWWINKVKLFREQEQQKQLKRQLQPRKQEKEKGFFSQEDSESSNSSK